MAATSTVSAAPTTTTTAAQMTRIEAKTPAFVGPAPATARAPATSAPAPVTKFTKWVRACSCGQPGWAGNATEECPKCHDRVCIDCFENLHMHWLDPRCVVPMWLPSARRQARTGRRSII